MTHEVTEDVFIPLDWRCDIASSIIHSSASNHGHGYEYPEPLQHLINTLYRSRAFNGLLDDGRLVNFNGMKQDERRIPRTIFEPFRWRLEHRRSISCFFFTVETDNS